MVKPHNKRKRKHQQDALINKNLSTARKKRMQTVYNLSRTPNRNFTITNEDTNNQVPDLIKDIDIDNSVKKAISMLTRTKGDNSNDMQCNTSHAANICVVCDTFIIGMEPIEWLSKEQLLKHKVRLSVANYESFFNRKLPSVLVDQYNVEDIDLRHMLLSPRAKTKDNKLIYMCCTSCKLSLSDSKAKTAPPRHAIANGFVIGSVPSTILPECDITELLAAMIAPLRPFNYAMSYSGGAHKSIKGHHSFFEQNVEHIGGLIQNYFATGNMNPHVYCILCGRFTLKQKEIARQKCQLDSRVFLKLIEWYIKESGHTAFKDMVLPKDCPKPVIIEEEATKNNIDNSTNQETEERYEGARYYFPSAYEPNEDTGTHDTQKEFAQSIMNNTAPTLLFHGGNYGDSRIALIENIFPLQFPFGIGGFSDKRPNQVSKIELMKHYLKLSLPQFQRHDFILVIMGMYQREKTFQCAIMSCKATSNLTGCDSFAEEVSMITQKDIESAVNRNEAGLGFGGGIGSKFLKQVSASCRPVAHTNEAATFNRANMFAMWEAFGPSSVFYTVTPCDETSFRIRLFAFSGSSHQLPSMDWSNEKCIADLNFRKKTRVTYPGACAIEFNSVLHIIIECLIGWDIKKGKGCKGIMGVPEAYAIAIEEQGRKTLHAHIQVWIKDFNTLQTKIYDQDSNIRDKARKNFINYIDKVMTSTYGDDLKLESSCCFQEDISNVRTTEELYDSVPLQDIRDMRHRDLAIDHMGKVSQCKICKTRISSTDIIEKCTDTILQSDTDSNHNMTRNDLTKEKIETWCARHVYDFNELQDNTQGMHVHRNLKLRRMVLSTRFDEHDYLHRKSCFKKSVECRACYPQIHCKKTSIDFDTEENSVLWHYIDRPASSRVSFNVNTKRGQGDHFLNTHSVPTRDVLACNTNVQLGSMNHMFYTTCYASKSTQDEDTKAFQNVSNALVRRITRNIMKKRAEICDEPDLVDDENNTPDPDFVEGLSRLLCGISSHLGANVCAAPMAHIVVVNDSRFMFSHPFGNLLLSQMEDYIDDTQKNISFQIRTSSDNISKTKVKWPDFWASDYIWRPEELQHISAYEYVKVYERMTLGKNRRGQGNDQDAMTSPDTQKRKKAKQSRFYYLSSHAGHKYIYVKKRARAVVPKIMYSKGDWPDIESLELYRPIGWIASTAADQARERYAKMVMMVFYPFRELQELKCKDTGKYWPRYQQFQQQRKLYSDTNRILQNIQDKKQLQKLKRVKDPVMRDTECKASSCQNTEKGNDDEDTDVSLFEESLSMINCDDPLHIDTKRYTHELINSQSKFSNEVYVTASYNESINVIIDDTSTTIIQENNENHNNENYVNVGGSERISVASMIEIITKKVIDFDGIDDDIENIIESDSEGAVEVEIGMFKRYIHEGKLDEAQAMAFVAICSTFMIHCINMYIEQVVTVVPDSLVRNVREMIGVSDSNTDIHTLQDLKEKLIGLGGDEQLLMFLTGAGGTGKSHVIFTSRSFCQEFSDSIQVMFDRNSFMITACTGSAASLLDGTTIHGAAHMMKSKIIDEYREDWKGVRIVFIDECSFFGIEDLQTLDKKLRLLRERNKPYGGVSIVFAGDFYQLKAIKKTLIYKEYHILWHSLVTKIVKLKTNHRFDDDPEFGELLDRYRNDVWTEDDIKTINSRIIGASTGVMPPNNDDIDVSYACALNKERNVIATTIFSKHVNETHPVVKPGDNDQSACDGIPRHTIIIESLIQTKAGVRSEIFHNYVIDNYGDADVKEGSGNRHIDPALKFYSGIPLMITTNKDIAKGRGNGTLCRGISVKLKKNSDLKWKNWDGRKVLSVSIKNVDYMLCEHWKEKDSGISPKRFKLHPEKCSVSMKWKVNNKSVPQQIKGLRMTQFPVNSNIATTGHKLQGQTKKHLIVTSWNYTFPNWVYVVLSRVKTLRGLFLVNKLNDDLTKYQISDDLKREDERLDDLDEQFRVDINWEQKKKWFDFIN